MTEHICETCGRAHGYASRECVSCRVRRYRSDPEKRERDREASRRWKREHLGQPGLPVPRGNTPEAKDGER